MESRKRSANSDCRVGVDVRLQKTAKLLTDMLKLEVDTVGYTCPDYMNTREIASIGFNSVWRSKVCEWFYDVIDKAHGNLSRDVVFIAMSILDRFVAKEASSRVIVASEFRRFYQLAALTSLYISVKVHYRKGTDNAVLAIQREGNRLSIEELLRMSTTGITREELQGMEMRILKTLAWKVCPPAPALFIRCLLALLPQSAIITQEVKLWVYEQAVFLAELAPCDYYFVGFKSSTIAYAAILASVRQLERSNAEVHHQQGSSLLSYMREAERITGLHPDSADVIAACERLGEIYELSSEGNNHCCRHAFVENTIEPHVIPNLPRVVSSDHLER